jgi:glycine/serine hydroxymethyltransferase
LQTAHANVQPHSGANADITVLLEVLSPGYWIMGLDLACGGYLTHGRRSACRAGGSRSLRTRCATILSGSTTIK